MGYDINNAAWVQRFEDGYQDTGIKDVPYSVRAVRDF
jgi:hypothetical protein